MKRCHPCFRGGSPGFAGGGHLVVLGATGDSVDGQKAGAAYVFEKRPGGWSRTKLLPPDREPSARFGWKVATDGQRVVVAAPWASNPVEGRSGRLYLYERTEREWRRRVLEVQDPQVTARIGRGLAMAGGRIVAGAPSDANTNGRRAGALVVFEEAPGGWGSETLVPSQGAADGWFGLAGATDSARVSASGYHTDQASGPEAGAASLFEQAGDGTWAEHPLTPRVGPQAGDHLGRGLALARGYVYLGAEEDDNANGVDAGGIFALRPDAWGTAPTLVIPDDGGPRSYLGFALATTARLLAASEDDEVRLFPLDPRSVVPTAGARLSGLIGRPLPGGVLALAGTGDRRVVGMPYADGPSRTVGEVLVVRLGR